MSKATVKKRKAETQIIHVSDDEDSGESDNELKVLVSRASRAINRPCKLAKLDDAETADDDNTVFGPLPEKIAKLVGSGANDPVPKSPCSICMDAVQNPALVSDCDHVFCWVCINEWAKTATNCPMCRKDFKWIKTKFLAREGPNKGKADMVSFEQKTDVRYENYVRDAYGIPGPDVAATTNNGLALDQQTADPFRRAVLGALLIGLFNPGSVVTIGHVTRRRSGRRQGRPNV